MHPLIIIGAFFAVENPETIFLAVNYLANLIPAVILLPVSKKPTGSFSDHFICRVDNTRFVLY